MQISIQFYGKRLSLDTIKDQKIIDIKRDLVKLTKVGIEKQLLFLGGVYLEDEKTLEFYGIANKGVLCLTAVGHTEGTCDEQTDVIISLQNLSMNDGVTNENAIRESKSESDTVQEVTANQNASIKAVHIDSKANLSNYRGICVIISNEKFTGNNNTRRGNNVDEENIKSTFESLGYLIKVYRDVKSTQMNEIIEETKKDTDKSYKMLILFILSHGCEDLIIFSDGIKLPFEPIWEPFTNANFLLFTGKPKLFFFVCCQGDKVNPGIDVVKSQAVGESIEHDGAVASRDRYPGMADLFFGYATCKPHVSGRLPSEGTFYVKSLCEVIRNNKKCSISDIHQEVQKNVSQRPITSTDDYQMPYFTNLLTEHAYLYDSDD